MSEFYCLTYEARSDGLLRVTKASLCGFDYTLLWEGREVPDLPWDLKLVGRGEPADVVRNSISWNILSQRFLELLGHDALRDLQIFPAPLRDETTSDRIDGYFIVNTVRRISCLDRKRSKFEVDKEFPDELVVYDLKIDAERVPADVNIFRVEESPYSGLIFRKALVESLIGKGLIGIAFIRH